MTLLLNVKRKIFLLVSPEWEGCDRKPARQERNGLAVKEGGEGKRPTNLSIGMDFLMFFPAVGDLFELLQSPSLFSLYLRYQQIQSELLPSPSLFS